MSARPSRDVQRVCNEIEGAGRNSIDVTVYAATEILALRKLVEQAQAWVDGGTAEGSVWLAEARRRLVKAKQAMG